MGFRPKFWPSELKTKAVEAATGGCSQRAETPPSDLCEEFIFTPKKTKEALVGWRQFLSILPCHLEDRDKELSTEVRLRKKITAQDGFANFTFPRSCATNRLL